MKVVIICKDERLNLGTIKATIIMAYYQLSTSVQKTIPRSLIEYKLEGIQYVILREKQSHTGMSQKTTIRFNAYILVA